MSIAINSGSGGRRQTPGSPGAHEAEFHAPEGVAGKGGRRFSLCFGVFLVSLGALSFEVSLTRLFSVAISYHFAFMVVSLALLGYGASGSFLTLFSSLLKKGPDRVLFWSAVLFSTSCVGAYGAANQIPFDPMRISWDRLQVAYLFADYLLLSVPFFFSGLCISAALTSYAQEAGRIYFSDLAGAGLGSLLVLFLFLPLGEQGGVLLPALVGALGALAFRVKRSATQWKLAVPLVIVGLLLFLMWAKPSFLDVRISPYKGLKTALWYPKSRILKTRWNAFSRVDVVDSPLVRFAPGLSLTFLKPIPAQLGITIDGDNMTAITRYDGTKASLAFLSHLPDALAYRLARGDEALVLESGGGMGVLLALASGVKRIDAVFDNPLVHRVVAKDYGAFGGNILDDPRVAAVAKSSRSFLRQTKSTYDVIEYSPLTSLGAASTGIRGLQENYMFTVEAIVDAFNHLRPTGVFSITQYLLPPPRQEIRLVYLVLNALAKVGISRPADHMAMIRTWGTFTLLLKRSPFSKEDIQTIRDFCKSERFDTVYFPGITEEEANRYNRFSRPIYFQMVQDLMSPGRRERFIEAYLFDLEPATDDRPFFFNFFRFEKILPLYRAMHEKWQPFVEGGYLVPVVLIESILASAFLILLPLVVKRSSLSRRIRRFRLWILTYFALLGWGYMFVEIVSIQKFVLFLDHPVYAMATVISGLLVSSGLGSFASQRLPQPRLRGALVTALFLVGVLIWVYLRMIPWLVGHFLGLGLGSRALVTLSCLFPLGFLMGFPFPLGIRFLEEVDSSTIPWAWCANGSFSVVGAVLSVVLALRVGFSGVLALAGAVYVAGGSVMLLSFLNLTGHGDETHTAQVTNV